jgi:hypothetical protein
MIDEVAKRRGADIVGTDQTQPGNPLPFRQRNSFWPCAASVHFYPFAPILLSEPLISREIFALCL